MSGQNPRSVAFLFQPPPLRKRDVTRVCRCPNGAATGHTVHGAAVLARPKPVSESTGGTVLSMLSLKYRKTGPEHVQRPTTRIGSPKHVIDSRSTGTTPHASRCPSTRACSAEWHDRSTPTAAHLPAQRKSTKRAKYPDGTNMYTTALCTCKGSLA
jgi:hypothetical protein